MSQTFSCLHVNSWKTMLVDIIKPLTESQISFYRKNNAAPEILTIVEMESKRFGTVGEKLIRKVSRGLQYNRQGCCVCLL